MVASMDETSVAERFVTLSGYSHAMCKVCTLQNYAVNSHGVRPHLFGMPRWKTLRNY